MAQHNNNEALKAALDRTLQLRAEPKDKPKPSPEELEEQVLQFLNALLKALPERESE
jgi:hypothetical protein